MGSDLYYDPTTLLECQKQVEEENAATDNRDAVQMPDFFMNDAYRGHHNFGYSTPPTNNRYNSAIFNSGMSQNQFYVHGSDMGTPIRMDMTPNRRIM